jgi:hypothetical protein
MGCVRSGEGEETSPVTLFCLCFLYAGCINCNGDPHPENSAQRRLGAEDSLCLGLASRGRRPVSFVLVYMPLRGERTINENKTNKQTSLNLKNRKKPLLTLSDA